MAIAAVRVQVPLRVQSQSPVCGWLFLRPAAREHPQNTSDSRHYPFKLPSGWVWTTLGEISNYGLCSNVPVTEIDNNSWVLELEDLEKDSAKILKTILRGNREINGVRHKFRKGEILYSKLRTYLNKVLVAPNDGFCTTEIIPFNTFADISNQYICHVLRSEYFLSYTHQCGYGVKMPRLSTGDACKALIPLPPINEQIKIVQAIDCYFNLIEYIENDSKCLSIAVKQAKNKILDLAIHGKLVPQDPADEPASELLKRVNPSAEITCDIEQYGNIPQNWVTIKLGGVGKWKAGATPNRTISEYYGGTIPWLKTGDLNDGFITKIPESITQKALDETSVCLNPTDSVLIAMYGATIGRVGILTFPATTNQACCACSGYFVNKMYLFYFLIANRSTFLALGGGGAQPNISKEKIVNLSFPLPPLAEQKRIVDKIEELFAQLDAIENSLQA